MLFLYNESRFTCKLPNLLQVQQKHHIKLIIFCFIFDF